MVNVQIQSADRSKRVYRISPSTVGKVSPVAAWACVAFAVWLKSSKKYCEPNTHVLSTTEQRRES